MPDCSPCGLAVDWLRSCYGSEWHFFADSPATKTGGRYYFSPPDTPFVGTQHYYGSRRWYESNYDKVQSLGEDLTSRQPWFNGEPPAVKPNPEQVGNDACLNFGDSIVNALGDDDMREGFINACFTPQVPLDPLWEMAATYDSCALQFFYATLLKWAGEGLNDRMTTAFHMLLGDDVQTFWVATVPPRPNVMIAKMPTFSVVVVDGTPDNQTLAMEAFASIVAPQDFGFFSTFPPWYALSNFINDLCNTVGVDANAPIMLVGYSMGAAIIDACAARWYQANPDRKIRTLTFGAPRPGDTRLQDLLTNIPGISIANDTDIVCSVPPTLVVTYPVATAFLMPALYVWADWQREPNRARQDRFGALTFNVDPIIDTPLLTHLLTQILLLQPFDIVLPHFIKEYRRRIEVRCPATQWPISEPLWIYLHGGEVDVNVGLALGCVAVDPFPPLVCNCGTVGGPEEFTLTIEAPDYPLIDGVTVDMVEDGDPSLCHYSGFTEVLPGSFVGVDITCIDTPDTPYLYTVLWPDSPYGVWEMAGPLTTDDFESEPWGFSRSDFISIDFTPTTNVGTITTTTFAKRIDIGIALGVQVIDVPAVETINVGLALGVQVANVGAINVGLALGVEVIDTPVNEPFNVGLALGVEVIDGPVNETFNVGLKIGIQVTD